MPTWIGLSPVLATLREMAALSLFRTISSDAGKISPGIIVPSMAVAAPGSALHAEPVVALGAVDQEGEEPADDEERDDRASERAEVVADCADRIPEGALQPELVADQAERFDPTDDQRRDHGDEGDGEVVVELADRLHEGPAVGAKHDDAIGRVHQRHAGGEQRREDQDRPDRQAPPSPARRDAKEAHFGRRVEAQAEEEPERIHVPAPLDQSEETAEDAAEEAALGEDPVEVVLKEAPAPPDRAEGLVDLDEDENVGRGNGDEEERRDAGADDAADFLEGEVAVRQRGGGERDQDGERDDHRRVAEREEETDRDRPLALLHQLPRDIVDRRDVVGVEGMAEAEAIGEEPSAAQDRRVMEGD